MKLEEIEKIWLDDSVIDETDLGRAALDIPKLHAKWYAILMREKQLLYGLSIKKDELELLLEAYYGKTLTQEELDQFDLPEYSDKKILRPDIPKHIASNEKMIKINLQIASQTDKIEFVKDVLKQIHGRSFIIKDAIQWVLFQAGAR